MIPISEWIIFPNNCTLKIWFEISCCSLLLYLCVYSWKSGYDALFMSEAHRLAQILESWDQQVQTSVKWGHAGSFFQSLRTIQTLLEFLVIFDWFLGLGIQQSIAPGLEVDGMNTNVLEQLWLMSSSPTFYLISLNLLGASCVAHLMITPQYICSAQSLHWAHRLLLSCSY